MVSNIPSGWYLCNGSNGTPDLRNTFVIGAHSDSGGSAKTTVTGSSTQSGGSKDAVLVSHTHNLQNHVHGVNLNSNTDTHNHSINDSGHTHNLLYNHGAFGGSSGAVTPRSGPSPVTPGITGRISTNTTGITINNDGHSHTVSGNTGASVPNTTDTLGESATNKRLPPYYALCYIMKS